MTTPLRDRLAALAGEALEIRTAAHEQGDGESHKQAKAILRALSHPTAAFSKNSYEALVARLRAETREEALATAWSDYRGEHAERRQLLQAQEAEIQARDDALALREGVRRKAELRIAGIAATVTVVLYALVDVAL